MISIKYNDTLYDILVMESKPSKDGICILETDLEVDFAPPLGYVEPDYKSMRSKKVTFNINILELSNFK